MLTKTAPVAVTITMTTDNTLKDHCPSKRNLKLQLERNKVPLQQPNSFLLYLGLQAVFYHKVYVAPGMKSYTLPKKHRMAKLMSGDLAKLTAVMKTEKPYSYKSYRFNCQCRC
uniref:Uncharacterized protein n=1 Tax=Amphimedon queenslandica TaxID=400682 RepID=A0A1X7T8U1_AMPQE